MEFALPVSKPVLIGPLTTAIKSSVPALNGITSSPPDVVFSRLGTTPFTEEEIKTIQRVVEAHDAEAIRVMMENRSARQMAERNADPRTLTIEERVHRLEAILGAEAT